MISKQPRNLARVAALLSMAVVSFSYAKQPDNVSTEERLRRLEQRMGQYEQTIAERDARIRELETERNNLKADTATPPITRL